MKFGLDQSTLDNLISVFVKYPEIEEVFVYGSRAKGNYHLGSDIDITLKGKDISDQTRSDVWLDIDDLNTPYLFDISIYCKLTSESLLDHIDRVGKLLYKRESKLF